jgi:glycosyltransferase involved in cell wall biosynthesis
VFLWELLAEAADLCEQPAPAPIDTPLMAARKAIEFASADTLLVYSDVHAQSFRTAGFDGARIVISPLWFDPSIWRADRSKRRKWDGTLRLLFVGGASLRKGIPFLIQAMRPLAPKVKLGLAGVVFDDMKPVIAANQDLCEFLGPQSKPALRDIYCAHDLLVLPSVADAFGFVALEAMSCGIPVVVTSTCGAPVPSETWRVPAMNVEALRARFEHYLSYPQELTTDGELAEQFAKGFTAETFRARMRECFMEAAAANGSGKSS